MRLLLSRIREGSGAPPAVVGRRGFSWVPFEKGRKAMLEQIIIQVVVALLVAAITGQPSPWL
jgi:hypothetical protein